MSEVKNSNASVADYLAFEALPEETKSLIQRLYGDHLAPGTYTEDDMRDAYESGWEDCAEEFERPWMSPSHVDYYLKNRKKAP
jgi:hypothetical protein